MPGLFWKLYLEWLADKLSVLDGTGEMELLVFRGRGHRLPGKLFHCLHVFPGGLHPVSLPSDAVGQPGAPVCHDASAAAFQRVPAEGVYGQGPVPALLPVGVLLPPAAGGGPALPSFCAEALVDQPERGGALLAVEAVVADRSEDQEMDMELNTVRTRIRRAKAIIERMRKQEEE